VIDHLDGIEAFVGFTAAQSRKMREIHGEESRRDGGGRKAIRMRNNHRNPFYFGPFRSTKNTKATKKRRA
jgi:hypothetical protein